MAEPKSRSWKKILPWVLGLLLCPCLGVLAVGLSPPWQRFPTRAKQSECQVNLKMLMVGERVRQRGYTTQFVQLEQNPVRGNLYAYFLGPGPLEDRSGEQVSGTQEAQGVGVDTWTHKELKPITLAQLPEEVARSVGVTGQCPEACDVTLVCAGNIDRDDTLDIWSISSKERIGPDGQTYPPFEPMNHQDDTKL